MRPRTLGLCEWVSRRRSSSTSPANFESDSAERPSDVRKTNLVNICEKIVSDFFPYSISRSAKFCVAITMGFPVERISVIAVCNDGSVFKEARAQTSLLPNISRNAYRMFGATTVLALIV
jgi:hypothetical protein